MPWSGHSRERTSTDGITKKCSDRPTATGPGAPSIFKSAATKRKLPADERITPVSDNWNFNAFCHNIDVAADSNAPEARRGVPYDTVCNPTRPIV